MSEKSTRRLAAIMIADIAGYTRLMEADERGTHVRVQRLFAELVEPTIAEHRGRMVKTRGDGFLSMFDSPVEAVRCAIVIQQSMVGRNLEIPNPQWVRFRIGVNLGDVIVEPDDIYGEGVNVAARLEQLAEPGNIYISGGVYEQVKHKLVCGYQSLGDRKVKNIVDPVLIYRVLPDPAALARAVGRSRMGLGLVAAAAVGALVVVGGWFGMTYLNRPASTEVAALTSPPLAPPVVEAPAGPAWVSTPPPPVAAPAPVAPPVVVPPVVVPPVVASPAVVLPPVVAPPVVAPPVMALTPPPAPVAQQQAMVVPPPAPARPEPQAIAEPEMVTVPGGSFRMGSADDPSEQPAHGVAVAPFLIGKYPVTTRQWRQCAEANACASLAGGAEDAPMTNVSWSDAQQYVAWIAAATRRPYRLPTEAEWEYAARGGTATRYWWGAEMKPGYASCKGCGGAGGGVQPASVGLLPANGFGLHDAGGAVAEWVEDCWHKDYRGAPADGSAWSAPNCRERTLRGGSWRNDPSLIRPASRDFYDASVRYPTHGLRLARSP